MYKGESLCSNERLGSSDPQDVSKRIVSDEFNVLVCLGRLGGLDDAKRECKEPGGQSLVKRADKFPLFGSASSESVSVLKDLESYISSVHWPKITRVRRTKKQTTACTLPRMVGPANCLRIQRQYPRAVVQTRSRARKRGSEDERVRNEQLVVLEDGAGPKERN